MAIEGQWWQRGIIYQIYPLSFMDGNGDGIGDLPGIVSRLDYVASLDVAAIWLSPIYPSPMADSGYDVTDHRAVDPVFGTMADFNTLVTEAHRRRLRVILDLVPNHTSDQHRWFIESRSSRDNPRRDWYIWRDPSPDGRPPNNWVSYFGSAWTYDARTGQYYLHQFREEQPELNYRNPRVLKALLDTMRFWLDRGVDGFRVDVIALLAKDPEFRDEPPDPSYRSEQQTYHSLIHLYTRDQPANHDYVRAMRRLLDTYPDRVLIGELDPTEHLMSFYGAGDECHLPFNFKLINEPWDAAVVRRVVDTYDASLPEGAWPNWVLGNHDRRRVASRVGHEQARLAQMLLLTLRGTPICYYGDELEMGDVVIPTGRLRERSGLTDEEAQRFSRDPQRTPMPWDASPNAGFCPPEVEPWLPLALDYRDLNVATEARDQHSMLTLFRRLAALRRATPALALGAYRSLDAGPPAVLAYERSLDDSRIVVALNLAAAPATVTLGPPGSRGEVLASTNLDRAGGEGLHRLTLRAHEGVVVLPAGAMGP